MRYIKTTRRFAPLLLCCLTACDEPAPGKSDAATLLPLGKADGSLSVDDRGDIAFEETKAQVAIEVGEYHGYRFAAPKGACVDIELSADVKKEPDTYLFLLQADGAAWDTLAEDDDGGTGLNSSLRGRTLPSSGEYKIVATSYQAEGNGSYTLSLSCCNDACAFEDEVCEGGFDEDGDGLVDCSDPDCEGAPNCVSGDGEICSNGVDDEGDGLTDCWDVDSCFFDAYCAGRPGRLAAAWEGTIGIHHAGQHATTEWGDVEWLPVYGHDVPESLTPVIVPQVEGASFVTTERQRSCAVVGEGNVYCWGFSGISKYALGLGGIWDDWNRIYEQPPGQNGHHVFNGYVERAVLNETQDFHDPNAYEFSELDHVLQVDAGRAHTCAVQDTGRVYCWGDNTHGQVGHLASHYGTGRLEYRLGYALEVPDVASAVQVSAGVAHTCARLADGTVSCWGDNEFGQLGDGTRFNLRTTPAPVEGLTDVTHVSAGDRQTCAVHGGGQVSCWGEIQSNLTPGEPRTQVTPYRVEGLLFEAEHVETAYTITCAVGSGAAACWVLGDMLPGHDGSPSLVSGVEDAVEVGVGVNHACFRRASGTFLCMGSNHDGQLGDGTRTFSQLPVAVVTNPI